MLVRAALAVVALIAAAPVIARDPAQVRAFKKAGPCPYTRASGCIVDHVVPLCAGGLDHPSNMQWQTVAEAKRKDRDERAACGALKRKAR